MRQHSRSLLIYVIFGILIAVFVINFGPSSGSACIGGMGDSQAARVVGSTVTMQEFVHSLQLLGLSGGEGARSRGAREFLLDQLIRRELLAHQAERHGIRVSDEEVEERISHGRISVAGQPWNLSHDQRFAAIYKDGFDYAQWKQIFCEYFLHTTPKKYVEELKRELLAEKMRVLLMASTQVSPEEAKLRYESQERKVKLGYVRFSSRTFEGEGAGRAAPSDDDVAKYQAANEDKIKKFYDANSYRYKGLPKEVKADVLLLSPPGKPSEKPSEEKLALLRKKAEELRKKAEGAPSFAAFAASHSTDERARGKAASLPKWIRKGGSGLGDAFETAVLALSPGQLTEVVATDVGVGFAKVEAVREGDLKLEVVASEIARELLIEEQAGSLAKKAAEEAAKKGKDTGKLAGLFPKKAPTSDGHADGAASADGAEGHDDDHAEGTDKDGQTAYYQETEPFARSRDLLAGVGISPEAVEAAFVQMKPGAIAGPFVLKDSVPSYVVIQLIERKEPDLGEFAKKRDEIARRFEMEKGYRIFSEWSQKRCLEVKQAGKILVNQEILSLGAAEGAPAYSPCVTLGMM